VAAFAAIDWRLLLMGSDNKISGNDDVPRDGMCLIVPVFNERKAAEHLGERLDRLRQESPHPLEIIVVDDGSNDGTERLLDALRSDWVTVLRHSVNLGYGAALRTGVLASRSPWVAITDADDTYPEHRLPEFLDLALESGYDMVVGARTGQHVSIPLARRFPKWLLRRLASLLSGRQIPDLNSGLRLMRRDMVERYLPVLPAGFSFTSTITIAALSSGSSVAYVPVDYARRSGRSKIRPIRDTLAILQLVLRAAVWFNPLRTFLIASLALVGMAFLVLVGSVLAFGRVMDVTFGVLMMSAVMVLAVGMLADFIDKRLR
jgi:glycosyltransferase involved in cell wall biosynthesis